MKHFLLLFMFVTFCTGACNAATLFNNGLEPSNTTGYCSDCAEISNPNWRVFDSFILGSDSILTGIKFSGKSLVDSTGQTSKDNINISIWADIATNKLWEKDFSWLSLAPSSMVAIPDGFYFHAELPNLAFGAGTYWLSIYSSYYGVLTNFSAPIPDRSMVQVLYASGGIHPKNLDATFQIIGDKNLQPVPEPSTLILIFAGVLSTLCFRAIKRKRINQ